MTLSGRGKLAGIVGWPVAHSLSPQMHNYWLTECGIDGVFVPLPTRPEDFATVIGGLRRAGFKGVSVTIPHKEAAFALANRCNAPAIAAGAVNQLVFHGGGEVEGLNTDAGGLAATLRESGESFTGKRAILLGAGGAARAAILALNDLAIAEIRILNRKAARAESLASELAPQVKARLRGSGMEEWATFASDSELVVHATSAGMSGAPSLDLLLHELPKSAVVCDIVFNPLRTELLERAEAAGLQTVDGLGMLMHQAVPAFHAFFGVTPKVTPELRRTLEQALGHGR